MNWYVVLNLLLLPVYQGPVGIWISRPVDLLWLQLNHHPGHSTKPETSWGEWIHDDLTRTRYLINLCASNMVGSRGQFDLVGVLWPPAHEKAELQQQLLLLVLIRHGPPASQHAVTLHPFRAVNSLGNYLQRWCCFLSPLHCCAGILDAWMVCKLLQAPAYAHYLMFILRKGCVSL